MPSQEEEERTFFPSMHMHQRKGHVRALRSSCLHARNRVFTRNQKNQICQQLDLDL